MRRCDSLPPISPRFVSFAWRYHRCVRGSSPPAPDAEPWINRELVGGISSRRARWKRQGLPSSRRNPCDHSPYSSDPGVTRQAEWTMSKLPGAAPATDNDEGSPRGDFGAQSHSVRSGCLRFAGVVTHPPRKTRFRLLVRLYRTGLVTRRVPSERFHGCNDSPFPSFLARGQTYYMVGPAMSAYMLCDWQLWLWREGLTAVFANFKLDSFHEVFVKKFGKGAIPADEKGFAHWWHVLLPDLPPQLANECIWLAVENKLVDPWTVPIGEPATTEGVTPASTRLTYPFESEFIEALREGVRLGRTSLDDGRRIDIKLKEGGYEGGYSVVINPDDQKKFVVIGSVEDPEHFPRRIRVAAWALKLEEEFGRFLIKHFHDTGIVTIEREDDGNQGTTTSTGGEQGRETSGDVLVIVPRGYTKVWDSDPHRGSVQAKDAYTCSSRPIELTQRSLVLAG